jgi:hypothetical protein
VPRSLDRPGQQNEPGAPALDVPARLPSHSTRPSPPPRPDRPDQLSSADRALTDQPAAWSRADLQHRLDRLPPGHPSSTRDADLSRDRPADSRGIDHGRDDPEREPDAPKHNYWTEVPRFLRSWADHVRKWPGEHVAALVDRARDPEGSWRGAGGQYLDPDQHTEAKNVILRVQQAEEALTKRMGDAERETSNGGWREGLEFRLKDEDRLKEKIAEKLEHEPDRTAAAAMEKINDAIRYTFCFEAASYSDGYHDIKHWLEASEYKMFYSKNHWRNDPEYKGVNTRWATPEGQRFEIQFHTAESFDAKQKVTHKSYERLRSPLTSDDERQELRAFQRNVCSWLAVPEGASAISDYPPERP